jgi:hypothetical protein
MNALKRILLRVFPFLRGQPPLEQEHIERILLIGCASRLNIERAVEAMRSRFPAARIALLVPQDATQRAPAFQHLDAVIPYVGLPATRRVVAEARYDLKVVLFTGEGQTRLKLLSFLLPARSMLAFTEGGGAFSWSFDQRLAIWNHLKSRLSGGGPLPEILMRLLRGIVTPVLSLIAFIVLLLWHARLLVHRKLARRRPS